MEKKYACPVCGAKTITDPGEYDFCNNCGWFDDPYQKEHPDYHDGDNNGISLNEAKEMYAKGIFIAEFHEEECE